MTNEALQQQIERLEQEIINLKLKFSESKTENKPYEVKVPEDVEYYLTNTPLGREVLLMNYLQENRGDIYIRGLAFKNRKELEQYDKKRILLFKLHKWAEEQNGNWYPYWEQSDDKFYIYYFYNTESFCVGSDWNCNTFNKLPYFKSEEIAKQFIEEFGDEIKEVFC